MYVCMLRRLELLIYDSGATPSFSLPHFGALARERLALCTSLKIRPESSFVSGASVDKQSDAGE